VFRTFDIGLRRNLLILFIAGLLFWSSMASLLPTLPLYVEYIGGSKQQIGTVMGSFAIGLLLFRPKLGKMADKQGRKIVLLIGLTVATITPLGYLFVKSIPLLMVLRVFHGISVAAFTTGYLALVADLAPADKRGEVIGYMSLINPLGLAIGPTLGGYLQAASGYPILFLVASELALGGLLCVVHVNHTREPTLQNNQEHRKFWQILMSPKVRIPTFIMLIVGLVFGTLSTFVPLYIKETQVDLNPGLFYTAAAISSFSTRMVTGKASDRLGRGLFVTIALVFYGVSMIMLWKADSTSSFLLAAVVEGVGGGTLIPMVSTMMADRSQPEERGRTFAMCITGFDLGIALAGPLLGLVAEELGYANLFLYASGLSFLGILVFLTQSSKDLNSSVRFALGKAEDAYALKKSRL
jgi:MFS family permease